MINSRNLAKRDPFILVPKKADYSQSPDVGDNRLKSESSRNTTVLRFLPPDLPFIKVSSAFMQ